MIFERRRAQPPVVAEEDDAARGLDHGRRKFLGAAAGLAASAAALAMMPDEALAAAGGQRRLRLANINTGEHFDGIYWRNGKYVPDAMKKLNVFMRDYRAQLVHPIDPGLFDLLASINLRFGLRDLPFKVISGYRSPMTNAVRREVSGGVAKNSYHIKGQAVDITVDGHSLSGLYKTAVTIKGGGVGIYPTSNFIHVDTGPVRTWRYA